MLIETGNRLQRLESCAQILAAGDSPEEVKAEGLLYIGGFATFLKGAQASKASIDEPGTVEFVLAIDDFCQLVENSEAKGA